MTTDDQSIINAALAAQAAGRATISRVKLSGEGQAKIVAIKDKPLGFGDKIKRYYKQIIVVIGAILVTLNELDPITNLFSMETRHVITVIITVITTIGVVLKENEHWIENIPS
jgi:hypothetical protein